MKPISSAYKDYILVLCTSGLSTRQIASKTGLSKSTIATVIKQHMPEKENHKIGCPLKLTLQNKRAIVHQILSGKASNATQATKFIKFIISTSVSTQTVRNTLKAANLKTVTKKKKSLLSAAHCYDLD
ncbi:hypothetical protein EV424DRAFT_1544106 [Suillus variegatus]|nr:hypothetical protein EV424DRAFT_1544106 [Suillus variegatus]